LTTEIVLLPTGIDPLSLLLASISLSRSTLLDTLEMYSDREIIRVTSAAVKISGRKK
jgi:hypothetical protein